MFKDVEEDDMEMNEGDNVSEEEESNNKENDDWRRKRTTVAPGTVGVVAIVALMNRIHVNYLDHRAYALNFCCIIVVYYCIYYCCLIMLNILINLQAFCASFHQLLATALFGGPKEALSLIEKTSNFSRSISMSSAREFTTPEDEAVCLILWPYFYYRTALFNFTSLWKSLRLRLSSSLLHL